MAEIRVISGLKPTYKTIATFISCHFLFHIRLQYEVQNDSKNLVEKYCPDCFCVVFFFFLHKRMCETLPDFLNLLSSVYQGSTQKWVDKNCTGKMYLERSNIFHLFCIQNEQGKYFNFCFSFVYYVVLYLSHFSDRWKLCVHFEEPLIQASCRNISGTADGNRWAWWITLWWCQWKRCREFRMLGEEEEEKEITGSGNEKHLLLHCK